MSIYSESNLHNMINIYEKTFVNIKTSSGHDKREVKTNVRSLTRTVVTEGLEEGEKILLGKPEDNE